MLASLLVVGSLALHACSGAPDYRCGTLVRPLDPSGMVRGTIPIAFMWLPHRERTVPSQGVIVAAEGGPGYPSGASRDGYRTLFGSLLQTHDMLLMDDRGTGNSRAIDCRALQAAMMLANVARCGAQLGPTADLYGSALAADDLAALLHALRIARVDIYGDSYGTFFVQTFAGRHPNLVKSVVLDGAYPVVGGDPWYPSVGTTFRRAFDLVCQRAPSCAARGGSSLARIAQLLRALRQRNASVTPAQLAFIMTSAGLDAIEYDELDAAARAYLGGDRVPLQRLASEAYQYNERGPSSPRALSQGLFAAASCSDNPQAYDMRLPPSARIKQWKSRLRRKASTAPTLFAPFSLAEYLAIPLDFAYVPLCQNWPVAASAHPAGQPLPPGARMPNVPTLVLTGDLDTITTPEEGDAAAALFPNHRRVMVANSGHVTGIADVYDCASRIIRRFIARQPYDATCAAHVPPLRLVSRFARRVASVAPATALRGNAAGTPSLRVAAAAVLTAGDALARVNVLGITASRGLRGGRFSASIGASHDTIALRDDRWTEDLPVTGNLRFDSVTGAVRADLRLASGTLDVRWNAYARADRAAIVGTLHGLRVVAAMSAP